MAKVTSQGWESSSYDDILADAVSKAGIAFSDTCTTTPESVFGQLASIISAGMKDLNDLGQAVTDTQNRDTAEGIHLNYLADLIGLSRLEASGATGNILFTGDSGTVIPVNTACKTDSGEVILSKVSGTLNRANCFSSTFTLRTVQDNTTYTINIENSPISIDSGVGNDEESILNLLMTSVNNNSLQSATVDTSVPSITVTYQNNNNLLTTTNSDNMNLSTVGMLISCESANTGSISLVADEVSTLVTPNLGVALVNNPADFQTGRDLETDPELRLRMDQREQSTGTATKPAIEASLSEISGVTSAVLVVNDTLVDDINTGVSAKSFEAFVDGGDENTIAEVLHGAKALFGTSQGTVQKTVIDSNGDTQGVRFSRPSERFAWVRITYAIDNEGTFPSNGEELLVSQAVAKGVSFAVGEDLEATKFYGSLYAVHGVYISNVEVALTDTTGASPAYGTTTLPVSKVQLLNFSTDRVVVTT